MTLIPGKPSRKRLERFNGKTYLRPATFAAMTTDQIVPGSGVAPNYFYYLGDRFGFGYGFGLRTIPARRCRRRARRSQMGWPTGVYIVVDRAEDMFFVVMQDSPSGRQRVNTTIKKIIYDALEK